MSMKRNFCLYEIFINRENTNIQKRIDVFLHSEFNG